MNKMSQIISLGTSLNRCLLTCGGSNRLLWPIPRSTSLGNDVTTFDPSAVSVVFDPPVHNVDIETMLNAVVARRRDALTSSSGVKAVGNAAGPIDSRTLVNSKLIIDKHGGRYSTHSSSPGS